jgi:hypothetical protein
VTRAPPSPAYQPTDAELRMLGTVLFQSIRDAWQRGHDRVWFRGYCVEAVRVDGAAGGHPLLMLTLRIAGAPGVPDRAFIAVAPYPIPSAGCDIRLQPVRNSLPCCTESPVGCVSPIDVRNASPETGHVSCKPASRKAWRFCQCFLSVTQSGSSLPALGVVSLFPCVPCP